MLNKSPLPAGFMLIGILGSIIFGIKLFHGTINQTWGFTMLLISAILFIASVVSITPSLPKAKDLEFQKEIQRLKQDYGINESAPIKTFKTHVAENKTVEPKKPKKRSIISKRSKSAPVEKPIPEKPVPKELPELVVTNKTTDPIKKTIKTDNSLKQDVKPDFNFILSDGRVINNLTVLADALETMNPGTFSYHVNAEKNDFYNWIKDEYKNRSLYQKIRTCNDSQKMAEIIRKALD